MSQTNSGTSNSNNSDWVRLNVGGKTFQTTKDTLSRCPDSFLARLVNGELPSEKDGSGAYLIDGSPEHFDTILTYLRRGVLNMNGNQKTAKDLLCEADFYNIQPLVDEIRKAMSAATKHTETILMSVEYEQGYQQSIGMTCSEQHDDYEVLQALRAKYNITGSNGKYRYKEWFFVDRQMEIEMVLRSFGFVEESYNDKYFESGSFLIKCWKFNFALKSTMNTWLLLDILKFMDRDQLESVQITSRVLNNMIRQNFASEPYRIPRHNNPFGASLEIEFKDDNLHLRLSNYCFYIDPCTRKWNACDDGEDSELHYYPIQEMRPLIAKTVRIPDSAIYVTSDFTIWHIEELESISHLWSERLLIIEHDSRTYEISIDLMFQSSKLLCCKTLHFSDHETIQLHLYPLIYTVDCINCYPVSTSNIVEIVREKANYPQSNTIFDLSTEFLAMKEAIEIIREDFLASLNPYGFEVIFVVIPNHPQYVDLHSIEKSQLKFRVENKRTKEVLQLSIDKFNKHIFLFKRYFL
ncbi:BTB/POZ domain-containing protein [Ditylenchus destructor]|nr:BTB/POZ domain-containing protein [Ditylenchus destructor]